MREGTPLYQRPLPKTPEELRAAFITVGEQERSLADFEMDFADIPDGLASAQLSLPQAYVVQLKLDLCSALKRHHRDFALSDKMERTADVHNDVMDEIRGMTGTSKGTQGAGPRAALSTIGHSISEARTLEEHKILAKKRGFFGFGKPKEEEVAST